MKNSYLFRYFFVFVSTILIYATINKTIENSANDNIKTSIKQAVVVFASAKALNSVISFAKGTKIEPPGITFAIGEFLDPINDLVERFSIVMLISIISLGIQKIILLIVSHQLFDYIFISFLIIINIFVILKTKFFKQTIQFLLFLITIKFAVSIFVLGNNFIYNNFIKTKYNIEKSNTKIVSLTEDIKNINNQNSNSFFNFTNLNISAKIDKFKNKADQMSHYIVDLIVVFLFQSIFSPLLFIFLLKYIFKIILNKGV